MYLPFDMFIPEICEFKLGHGKEEDEFYIEFETEDGDIVICLRLRSTLL